MTSNEYLLQILTKYQAKDLFWYSQDINNLHQIIKSWAGDCLIDIKVSGSRAKGTAIHLASDVDYLISLSSNCNENNGSLKGIYDSLHTKLKDNYQNVRKQNVSFRIMLSDLEVDVTPARKYAGNTNYHSIYVSKKDTWKQANIQKHINDISNSTRTGEIKLLKIWRKLNDLDFPSIYMEYLVIQNLLYNKSSSSESLANNFNNILSELARDENNPLFLKVVDPSNTNNILSDLLDSQEKNKIVAKAKKSLQETTWEKIIY